MRRFGLDVKKDNEMAASKVEKASLDDEIKAKRLERFGQVDPADLKGGSQKKRNKKFEQKRGKKQGGGVDGKNK